MPTTRSTRCGSGRSRPAICRGWRRRPRRRCSVSTNCRSCSGLGLQHAAERMSFEQVPELQYSPSTSKLLCGLSRSLVHATRQTPRSLGAELFSGSCDSVWPEGRGPWCMAGDRRSRDVFPLDRLPGPVPLRAFIGGVYAAHQVGLATLVRVIDQCQPSHCAPERRHVCVWRNAEGFVPGELDFLE